MNILILGGGSAGWLAAAYLSRTNKVEIKLPKNSKPIGVGESTLPGLVKFFDYCEEDLLFLGKRNEVDVLKQLKKVVDSQFNKITYTEAVELLKNSGKSFEYPADWGKDLQTEHEKYLAEEKFHGPVVVTDFPKEIKAFYMRLNDDEKTMRAMDILLPGIGEIIGGSQREERLDFLQDRIKEMGFNEDDYWWY